MLWNVFWNKLLLHGFGSSSTVTDIYTWCIIDPKANFSSYPFACLKPQPYDDCPFRFYIADNISSNKDTGSLSLHLSFSLLPSLSLQFHIYYLGSSSHLQTSCGSYFRSIHTVSVSSQRNPNAWEGKQSII